MNSETAPIPISSSDWDNPLTDDDLQAIDEAFVAVISDSPIKRCRRLDTPNAITSIHTTPGSRRRLPDSLFALRQPQNCPSLSSSPICRRRSHPNRNSFYMPAFREIKFGGRIVYSRTVEEVERAVEDLIKFVKEKREKEGHCVLGLDIEWRPTFQKGVAPGKASVMQICGEEDLCHVLHIIHSQVPKKLQSLLEDTNSLKVGVCIANDATKVLRDHNVPINNLGDLSDFANLKLGGHARKWSLSTLTEMLICKQLPKPNKIRLGNWEANVLSKEQLNYAATDAYVSWYIYQVLKNLPAPTNNEDVETVTTPK